ncbi:hypothetical protein J537_1893 [Acinetobacter baumannii 1437282]|nr:hypothetical protein J537_1893 [Acinetobacter baumannii 1437282]
MKIIVLILGTLASSFSFGADWGKIGESSNRQYFYDVNSVKRTGKYQYEFWEKHIGKKNTDVIRSRVDCNDDSYTILDAYIYQGDDVLDSSINQEYRLIPPPDTVAYLTLERVCNYGVAAEVEKFNLPKKSSYTDDLDFQVARFNAFGFKDYIPTESMMNEYFSLMDEANKEEKLYKKFIKVLDGVYSLKIKYLDLKQ